MSSPFPMPSYGAPDRGAASSPALAPKPLLPAPSAHQQPNKNQDGVSIRPMRLKVLYTFDDANKTNCLARWPQVLDVRTAFLDESQQIGLVELKVCLRAIVSASPELVARLGQDYTVYAYDYAEYETPLVGQGMLSWILSTSSSTPSAPAHQSKTLVTGRVCKNILGLFASASQETLEVKLRLVPVPTCLQSEYVENMKKYSDISKFMPNGFDFGAWAALVQSNPAILQLANGSRSQTPATGTNQREGIGMEHVQHLLTQGTAPFHSGDVGFGLRNTNSTANMVTIQQPRPSSPALSVQSATGPVLKKRGRPPKNKNKPLAGSSDVQRKPLVRQETFDQGYGSNDDRLEDGSTRKRAKVTKANMPDTGAFAHQPESLRVAASTAASLRIHQPSAIRPSANHANSLETQPRAPTPIANPMSQPRRPQLPTARSSLRQESLDQPGLSYESPYAPSEGATKPPESVMTSPEDSRADSLGETPADISSSPPVYRGISTAPSSPKLPVLPRDIDSGFMSGSLDDLFGDDELRPIDDEDLEIAAQYCKRTDLLNIPNDFLETSEMPVAPPRQTAIMNPDDKARAISRKAARSAVGLGRTASSGCLSRPSAIASDPVRPSNLHRSQSWAGHQQPHPTSDISIADDNDFGARPTKPARRGSGAEAQHKKDKIRSKLHTSIAAGEMPPYCDNCGAIETPTWRKAFAKVHSGTPEHVRLSDDEGGILAWQKLQTDESGTVCLYRIFKKSLLATDEHFTEILLCNPCGLYLHKKKCMRPKENWEKAQRDADRKRRRSEQQKKAQGGFPATHPASDASQGRGDGHSNASSPAPGPTDGADDENVHQMSPRLPVFRRPRAASVRVSPSCKRSSLAEGSAALALQKAIQSSPARLSGTQGVPIDVEQLTPRPTRRVLFPTPPKAENLKTTDVDRPQIVTKSNCANADAQNAAETYDKDQMDKENRPPSPEQEDTALDDLFEENEAPNQRPSTPTPTNDVHGPNNFKTPKNNFAPHRLPPTTGDFFSSTAKALLQNPTTPRRSIRSSSSQPLGEMTPFTAHLNQLFSDGNGSPSADFDFPSLPSLHNTPGRTGFDYSFANLDSQDFFSTDGPMPSSPPVWFGVYEDPDEQGTNDLLHDDHPLHDEDRAQTFKASGTPSLLVDEHGRASVNTEAMV